MSQTKEHYDVIVIGVGGMGSAVLHSLASRNVGVCGIEQFGIAHSRGSSHGETRIIRKAYFEHPDYMPLLDSAYEMWDALESEAGVELKVDTGLLIAGLPGRETVAGLEACYKAHDRPHEHLKRNDIEKRFPQFKLPEVSDVYYDPLAGFLRVEACVRAQIELALRKGATLFTNEQVLDWSSENGEVTVWTNKRMVVAQRLILTTGAWAKELLRRLGIACEVWRRVVCWYSSPNLASYTLGKLPIFYIEKPYGHFYGFPAIDDSGIKIAEHINPDIVRDADEVNWETMPEDETLLLRFLEETFVDFQPRRTRSSICMYTMTPDENFVLDIHPEHENVVFGAGFSGHGYKFAPVVGEILSDLAIDRATSHPIGFLRLSRFDTLLT